MSLRLQRLNRVGRRSKWTQTSSAGDAEQTLLGECFANVARVLTNDEFRGLLSGAFLGHVAQAVAFDQAVEFFGEIGGVIAGGLESLCHQ